MARVKVTQANIKSKLNEWKNGQNIVDHLVFLPSEGIDTNEIILKGWDNNVIIKVEPDQSIFQRFIYVEKL
jgi:hypothetical protein